MNTDAIWESEKGTFIRIIVKTNSKSREFLAEITSEAIHVNLSGPAREGKANSELIRKIAKALDISTSSIALISGHRNREKTLLITGVAQETVVQKLSFVI
jgi:uncharacterized protein (TIGR00251 family)